MNVLTYPDPIIWLSTGDSITHGLHHTNGHRSSFELLHEVVRGDLRRFRDVFINTAIAGDRLKDILVDFNHRIARWQPDIVSLMIGTNDCAINERFKELTPESFHTLLEDFIHACTDLGARVVLQTPPPVDCANSPDRSRITEFVDTIRHVANMHNVVLADHYEAFLRLGGDSFPWALLDDPFHPNALGHAAIALELSQALGLKETPTISYLRHWLGTRGMRFHYQA